MPLPSPAAPPAVEISGLVKRYGHTTAVDDLSLHVPTGQVTAVLGPNGAGKTTTIETCEGYRTPDAGVVRVLGLDPVRDATALRPRVGVMLQSGGVFPGARAGEMLRLAASLYAHPLDPAALADRLGLGSALRTPYRRLSGGQKQRLALALAVVGRPELVFLDEPTAGLDPQARHATWALVEQLRADGVTVVLATHHMEEAERLADHVVIVNGGRTIAQGAPSTLTGAGQENTLRFRASPGLDLDALLHALPAATCAKESPAGQYLVESPEEGGIGPVLLATVTAWCAANQVLVQDLQVGRRTLEDVFLDLTGRDLRQ